MTYSTINCAIEDRVMTVTLDRPEQMNAFTLEMADELVGAFTRASEDDGVGAIIVTGAGKAFCAGMGFAVLRLAAVGDDADRRGDVERGEGAFEAAVSVDGEGCDSRHVLSPEVLGDHPRWRQKERPRTAVTERSEGEPRRG